MLFLSRLAYSSVLIALAACGPESAGSPTDSDDSTGGTATTGPDTTGAPDPTTGGVACELVDRTCALAEQNAVFEDCGVVTHDKHTAEEWQTARDCVLAAVAERRGFKLIAWKSPVDSVQGEGYAGIVGDPYGVGHIYYDGFEGPNGYSRRCASLSPTPDCTVLPDVLCLTCDAPHGQAPLCPGP